MTRWAEPLGIAEQALGRSLTEDEHAKSVALFDEIVRSYPFASVQGEAGRLLIAGRDRDGTRRRQAMRAVKSIEEAVEFFSRQCDGLRLATGSEQFLALQEQAEEALSGARWVCWNIHEIAVHPEIGKQIDVIREEFAPDLPTHKVRAFGGSHSEHATTPLYVVGHLIEWWYIILDLDLPQNGPRQPFTRALHAVCTEGGIPQPSDHYIKQALRDARKRVAEIERSAATQAKAP